MRLNTFEEAHMYLIKTHEFGGDMHTYTFKEVEKYHDDIKSGVDQILGALEVKIANARDSGLLPVYLTKYRVKSLNSLYLKTKRKPKPIKEITDIGGFRVLCLFEQDIFLVNEFLCQHLASAGFRLKEYIVFNWKSVEDKARLNRSATDRFKYDFATTEPSRSSGYKSIHYVITQAIGEKQYNIEIQLRTLLQDVWGELEHALAYKQGSIHPHIKKSFSLLARDLETKDILLSHLKELYQNEKTIELFGLKNSGPYRVFGYEDECIPKLFLFGEMKVKYDEYMSFVLDETVKKQLEADKWQKQVSKRFKALTGSITREQQADIALDYWFKMEEAFIQFASFQIKDALESYSQIGKENYNRYVPFFRQGEILFIQGEIEKALVAFDTSEAILNKFVDHNIVNEYRLKVKLANIYWLLGEEYMPLSLEKINNAKDLYCNNCDLFTSADRKSLFNNLCWYELETYLISNNETDFNKAEKTFNILKDIIKKDSNISSNTLDTVAWFMYQKYLKVKKRKLLQEAQEFCRMSWDKKNMATNTVLSTNLHRNHIHTIMGA